MTAAPSLRRDVYKRQGYTFTAQGKTTLCEGWREIEKLSGAASEEQDEDAERKELGTTATRAGIIEKLISAVFAERKGKKLIPTKDGYNLAAIPVSYTHLLCLTRF